MPAGHTGFIGRIGIQLVHGSPERREWGLLACVIPDARRNHPAVAGDTRHLGQSPRRILHEMDDELC